jgi:transketolase
MNIQDLELKSIEYRRSILSMIRDANAGHTGGSLSCVDILNVLYNCVMNVSPANFHDTNRDRYIHSKGHSVEALYAVLADKGFFNAEDLKTVSKYKSKYVGHPTRKVNGIEHNTGGLGHGLSVAVGIALAAKMDNRSTRVFTLMGDGELSEGSIWEASMTAAHYKLDNLIAIIDRNTLQITGRTENVMGLEPLIDKFVSFGYAVHSVDGNNLSDLVSIFSQLPFEVGKPNLILAQTMKGKGISFIEDQVKWHHHVTSEEEYSLAMNELQSAEAEWQKRYGIHESR